MDLRFGGFTSVPWDSSGSYRKDANAFIFSLTNQLKFKANSANSDSVFGLSNYGPTFGGGHVCTLQIDVPAILNLIQIWDRVIQKTLKIFQETRLKKFTFNGQR